MIIVTSKLDATAMVEAARQTVGERFDHFCLTAGIATLAGMMVEDAERRVRSRGCVSASAECHCGRTVSRPPPPGDQIMAS